MVAAERNVGLVMPSSPRGSGLDGLADLEADLMMSKRQLKKECAHFDDDNTGYGRDEQTCWRGPGLCFGNVTLVETNPNPIPRTISSCRLRSEPLRNGKPLSS